MAMGHEKQARIVMKPCEVCEKPTTKIEIRYSYVKRNGALGEGRRKGHICLGCVGQEA